MAQRAFYGCLRRRPRAVGEIRCPAGKFKTPAAKGQNFLFWNKVPGTFDVKFRTWTTIPLKVGIIATFRGLLSDLSQ